MSALFLHHYCRHLCVCRHLGPQPSQNFMVRNHRRSPCPLSLYSKNFYADSNAECTVCSYPLVARNLYTFPMMWQSAMLLTNVSDGRALWKEITPGVPNILHKGQLNGSTTINVMYDLVNDPDRCEWHFLSPALPSLEGEGEVVKVTVRVTIRTRAFEDHATGPQAYCSCGLTVTRS